MRNPYIMKNGILYSDDEKTKTEWLKDKFFTVLAWLYCLIVGCDDDK